MEKQNIFQSSANLLLLIIRQNFTLEFKQDCAEIENIFVNSKKKKHGELSLNSNFSGREKRRPDVCLCPQAIEGQVVQSRVVKITQG